MATEIASSYVALIPQMKGVQKEVQRAIGEVSFDKEGQKSGSGFATGLGKGLKKATKIVGGAALAAGAAITGLAQKGGFDRALAIEGAEAKLAGLGHSAESVEQIMQNALGAVRGTAFGMGDAATVAASAVAAGIKPGEDLQRMLTLVGDAATIAGTDMSSMGAIFNKVAASNKVQMDVINQLHDAGVPALALLSEQMGVTAEEASKMASQGKIDFATFQAAIEDGMGGAALKSGETFTGALANTRAALGRLGLLAADPMMQSLKNIFNDAIPAIDAVTAGLSPLMADLSDKLSPIVADLSDKFFTWISEVDFGGVVGQVMELVSAFSPLGLAFKALQPILPAIGDLMGEVMGILSEALADVMPILSQLAMTLFPVLASVVKAVLPALSKLAGALLPALGAILEAVAPLIAVVGQVFGQVFVTALNVLLPLLMQIIQAVLPIVLQLVQMLVPVLIQIAQAIMPAFMAIITALMPILSTLIQALLPVLSNLVTALAPILAAVAPIFEMIVSAIAPLVEMLASLLIPIIEALMPVVDTVFGVITDLIGSAMEVIQGIIEVVTGIISGDWSRVWDGIKNVLDGVWNLITGIVQGAIDIVSSAISSTLDTIKSTWDGAWENVKTSLSDVWESIKTAVNDALDLVLQPIKDFKDDVIAFFVDAKDWLFESGKSLINGFKDGISAAFDGAKNIVEGGLNTIRNLFPFSPAKEGPFSGRGWVTYSGASLMEGFADGMKTTSRGPAKQAAYAMSQVKDALHVGTDAIKTSGTTALAAFDDITTTFHQVSESMLHDAANTMHNAGAALAVDLASGIWDEIGRVEDAAQSLTDVLLQAIGGFADSALSAGVGQSLAFGEAAAASVQHTAGQVFPAPPSRLADLSLAQLSNPDAQGLGRDDLEYLADLIVDGLGGIAAAAGQSADLLGGARRASRQVGVF